MRRASIWLAAGMLCLFAVEGLADELSDKVDQGVALAVDFLKSEQLKQGGWKELAGFEHGVSSLVTLALLQAGVPANDPAIVKSFESLKKFELGTTSKTYVVSLQSMALAAADPQAHKILLQRNANWFAKTQLRERDQGGWSYPHRMADNCNTAYAVQGLNAAAKAGAKIDPEVWRQARQYLHDVQNDDGSWGYQLKHPGTGSMTCASMTSLAIVAQRLSEVERAPAIDADDSKRLASGQSWLAENFAVANNPRGGALPKLWVFYYLQSAAQAARHAKLTPFVADHDWYREGAKVLLDRQSQQTGAFAGPQHPESNPLIGTSFALLFLTPRPEAEDAQR